MAFPAPVQRTAGHLSIREHIRVGLRVCAMSTWAKVFLSDVTRLLV